MNDDRIDDFLRAILTSMGKVPTVPLIKAERDEEANSISMTIKTVAPSNHCLGRLNELKFLEMK